MKAMVAVAVGGALLAGGLALSVGEVWGDAKAEASFEDEVKDLRKDMAFFMTPAGAYVAVAQTEAKNHVFFGTGRELYRQRVLISSIDDEDDISILFWAPNHARDGAVESDGQDWSLRCGEKSVRLAPVDSDERDVMVATAKFHERRFQRAPYVLARNDRGEYFYVDRGAGPSKTSGFHLYLGRSGKVTKRKLRWVVSDSEGDVFATKRGELRVKRDETGDPAIAWKPRGGKKRAVTPLLTVPIGQNSLLIYKELGVYENQRFGTPCDSDTEKAN